MLDLIRKTNEPYEVAKHADRILLADKDFAMAAVARDGETLSLMSNRLKGDKEIALATAMTDERVQDTNPFPGMRFASKEIKALVGDEDPVKALQSSILQDKLQSQLKNRNAQEQVRKIKI